MRDGIWESKQRDICKLYVLHASDLDPVDSWVQPPRISPSLTNGGDEKSTEKGLGHSMPGLAGSLSINSVALAATQCGRLGCSG